MLNFAVLAALIVWFLGKALPKTFKERTSTIQKSLVDARVATEQASARMSGIEERLSHIDTQISGLRAQSEKDSAADEVRDQGDCRGREGQDSGERGPGDCGGLRCMRSGNCSSMRRRLAIEQAAKKLVITAETDRAAGERILHGGWAAMT